MPLQVGKSRRISAIVQRTTRWRGRTPIATPPGSPAAAIPSVGVCDELPATLGLRKLAVISIADKVQADANYHLTADDVRAWERTNGMIPAGSVVMVR